MTPMRPEPAAPRSRVMHSTTAIPATLFEITSRLTQVQIRIVCAPKMAFISKLYFKRNEYPKHILWLRNENNNFPVFTLISANVYLSWHCPFCFCASAINLMWSVSLHSINTFSILECDKSKTSRPVINLVQVILRKNCVCLHPTHNFLEG